MPRIRIALETDRFRSSGRPWLAGQLRWNGIAVDLQLKLAAKKRFVAEDKLEVRVGRIKFLHIHIFLPEIVVGIRVVRPEEFDLETIMTGDAWSGPRIVHQGRKGRGTFHRDIHECLPDVISHRADAEAQVVEEDRNIYGGRVRRAVQHLGANVVGFSSLQLVRRNWARAVKKLDIRVIPDNCQPFLKQIELAVNHRVRAFVGMGRDVNAGGRGMAFGPSSLRSGGRFPTLLPQSALNEPYEDERAEICKECEIADKPAPEPAPAEKEKEEQPEREQQEQFGAIFEFTEPIHRRFSQALSHHSTHALELPAVRHRETPCSCQDMASLLRCSG